MRKPVYNSRVGVSANLYTISYSHSVYSYHKKSDIPRLEHEKKKITPLCSICILNTPFWAQDASWEPRLLVWVSHPCLKALFRHIQTSTLTLFLFCAFFFACYTHPSFFIPLSYDGHVEQCVHSALCDVEIIKHTSCSWLVGKGCGSRLFFFVLCIFTADRRGNKCKGHSDKYYTKSMSFTHTYFEGNESVMHFSVMCRMRHKINTCVPQGTFKKALIHLFLLTHTLYKKKREMMNVEMLIFLFVCSLTPKTYLTSKHV